MTEPFSGKRPIIVGVDGSDSSIGALREAAEIAEALGSPLEAITTWERPPAFVDQSLTVDYRPEENARAVLRAAVEQAFGDAPPPHLTTTTASGLAARTLIDLSKDARMLVVGSRGHGGFAGMLLGSVSAACAEYAKCSVLVVHLQRSF